jgi:putative two-component system response regulator
MQSPFSKDGISNTTCPDPINESLPIEGKSNQPVKILVVDDDENIRDLLTNRLSKQGFDCMSAESGASAIQLINTKRFDAVLADVHMPGMSGIELLQHLKARDPETTVLMITGNDTTTDAVIAMKLGADDYILKPFSFDEVLIELNRALERRQLRKEVQAYQTNLEQMVAQRTAQHQQLFVSIMQSLIFALEAKDPYTDGHSRRVAWLAGQLGARVGLRDHDLETIEMAAVFHDLGKIGISESILIKPKPLTSEEYLKVQTHPEIGARILQPMQEFHEILPIVRYHHEKFDGSGYPLGLKGDEIPLGSRIIAIIDAYDALTTVRPYSQPIASEKAVERLVSEAGTKYDPVLIDLFVDLLRNPDIQKMASNPDYSVEKSAYKDKDAILIKFPGDKSKVG